jgi:hypothetical protein
VGAGAELEWEWEREEEREGGDGPVRGIHPRDKLTFE